MPRLAASLEASFETPAQTLHVILRDISRHGAGIEAPPRAALGREGGLRVGDLALQCRVVWARRGLGGLKFCRPLGEGQMRGVQRMIEEGEVGGLAPLAAASRAWRWGAGGTAAGPAWGTPVSPAAPPPAALRAAGHTFPESAPEIP